MKESTTNNQPTNKSIKLTYMTMHISTRRIFGKIVRPSTRGSSSKVGVGDGHTRIKDIDIDSIASRIVIVNIVSQAGSLIDAIQAPERVVGVGVCRLREGRNVVVGFSNVVVIEREQHVLWGE